MLLTSKTGVRGCPILLEDKGITGHIRSENRRSQQLSYLIWYSEFTLVVVLVSMKCIRVFPRQETPALDTIARKEYPSSFCHTSNHFGDYEYISTVESFSPVKTIFSESFEEYLYIIGLKWLRSCLTVPLLLTVYTPAGLHLRVRFHCSALDITFWSLPYALNRVTI